MYTWGTLCTGIVVPNVKRCLLRIWTGIVVLDVIYIMDVIWWYYIYIYMMIYYYIYIYIYDIYTTLYITSYMICDTIYVYYGFLNYCMTISSHLYGILPCISCQHHVQTIGPYQNQGWTTAIIWRSPFNNRWQIRWIRIYQNHYMLFP